MFKEVDNLRFDFAGEHNSYYTDDYGFVQSTYL